MDYNNYMTTTEITLNLNPAPLSAELFDNQSSLCWNETSLSTSLSFNISSLPKWSVFLIVLYKHFFIAINLLFIQFIILCSSHWLRVNGHKKPYESRLSRKLLRDCYIAAITWCWIPAWYITDKYPVTLATNKRTWEEPITFWWQSFS